MKKLFFIIGIVSCVVLGYYLYNPPLLDHSTAPLNKGEYEMQGSSRITSSTVHIIKKTDIDIYRHDPYNFFNEIVRSIEQTSGGGRGFFVDEKGYILTNYHVVSESEAEYIVILENQDEYPATLAYYDADRDLALLKINSESEIFTLPEISADEIYLGQKLRSIGDISGSVTQTNIEITIQETIYTGLLQIDAEFSPGDSGSPLFGSDGKVVGLIAAKHLTTPGIGYVIPINSGMIDKILKKAQK